MKDYYLILEVHPKASKEIIQQAYRTLAKIYHPDNKTGNEQKMQDINEAYEILLDDIKRAEYDYEHPGLYSENKNQAFVMDLELQEKEREIKLKQAELKRREREVKIREQAYEERVKKNEKISKIKRKLETQDKIAELNDPEVPENKKYQYLKDLIRQGKSVVQPLKQAFPAATARTRFYIIQALAEIGDDSASFYIQALDDPDEFVRAEALHTLGVLKEKKAGEVITFLLDDDSGIVRKEACFALGQTGYTPAADKLLKIAKKKKEKMEVRISAVQALALCGNTETSETLQKLAIDKNENLKRAAEKSLFLLNQKSYFINKGV